MSKPVTCLTSILLAVGALGAGGCFSATSDRSISGPTVGAETLDRVQPGRTTREWLITTLGKPTAVSAGTDGAEILKYESTETVHNHTQFLLSSAREKITTARRHFFEVKDGIVRRHWSDSAVLKKESKLH